MPLIVAELGSKAFDMGTWKLEKIRACKPEITEIRGNGSMRTGERGTMENGNMKKVGTLGTTSQLQSNKSIAVDGKIVHVAIQ